MKTFKKIAAGLLIVALYITGITRSFSLMGDYLDQHFSDDLVFLSTGRMTVVPVIMLFSFTGLLIHLFVSKKSKDNEKKVVTIAKKVVVIVVASIIVTGCNLFSMRWLNHYTLDGIIDCKPGKVTEYKWEDAKSFKLDWDREGVLVFVIHMNDGKRYSFNGGILQPIAFESTAFCEKFEESVYDYMPWLAVRLKEADVPMDMKKWDKLMRKLDYNSWKDCAEKIRFAYENA